MTVYASSRCNTYVGEWGNPEPGKPAVEGTVHLVAVPAGKKFEEHLRLVFFVDDDPRRPSVMIPDFMAESVTAIEDNALAGLQVAFTVMDDHPTAPVDLHPCVVFVCSPSFVSGVQARFVPQAPQLDC